MTNFLGWELFPSGGSTVGTLGPCILLNVPKVGHPNVYASQEWRLKPWKGQINVGTKDESTYS